MMNLKTGLRNLFSPTRMLDTGYIDRFNTLPHGNVNGNAISNESLSQYVSNRFTRGNIRGQIFALLNNTAISERLQKASQIKWL